MIDCSVAMQTESTETPTATLKAPADLARPALVASPHPMHSSKTAAPTTVRVGLRTCGAAATVGRLPLGAGGGAAVSCLATCCFASFAAASRSERSASSSARSRSTSTSGWALRALAACTPPVLFALQMQRGLKVLRTVRQCSHIIDKSVRFFWQESAPLSVLNGLTFHTYFLFFSQIPYFLARYVVIGSGAVNTTPFHSYCLNCLTYSLHG